MNVKFDGHTFVQMHIMLEFADKLLYSQQHVTLTWTTAESV